MCVCERRYVYMLITTAHSAYALVARATYTQRLADAGLTHMQIGRLMLLAVLKCFLHSH